MKSIISLIEKYSSILLFGSNCGKTYTLRKLANYSAILNRYTVRVIDGKSLIEIRRGYLEEYLQKYYLDLSLQNTNCLILIDDIDYILATDCKINVSVRAAFLNFLDQLSKIGDFRYLATSSVSPAHLTPEFNSPFRLCFVIKLEISKDFRQRKQILQEMLCDAAVNFLLGYVMSHNNENSDAMKLCFDEGLNQLTNYSKGFSIGDVSNLIRECLSLYKRPMDEQYSVLRAFDLSTDYEPYHCSNVIEFTSILQHFSIFSVEIADKIAVSASDLCFISFSDSKSVFNGPEGGLIGFEMFQHQLQSAILDPFVFSHMHAYKTLNIRPSRGVIIHSEAPGCGKSALAGWLISAGGDKFKSIVVSCAELVQKVVGESERRISSLFQTARSVAPCFLLLENIDCLFSRPDEGDRRSARTSHHALDRILSSLLMEIDGIDSVSDVVEDDTEADMVTNIYELERNRQSVLEKPDKSVIVIATAGDLKNIDKALLRPGRLEEHIYIPLPSEPQRFEILRNLLSTISKEFVVGNHSVTVRFSPNIDEVAKLLSQKTSKRSPAELKNIISEGCMKLIRMCLINTVTECTITVSTFLI